MIDFSSAEVRRNPYPVYDRIRAASPVYYDEQSGLWMIFDYAGVRRALTDYETFSSRYGPGWMIFFDPPRHTKLRALVAKAFTPRSIANLESRIEQLTRQLLEPLAQRGHMDLASDFAVPLPMMVIAEMLGIPVEDRPRFKRWVDVMLEMSYSITGGPGAAAAVSGFTAATGEMAQYLNRLCDQRKTAPTDDLLTRLVQAEVDGERLTPQDILGFFQLLLLAGSETTTNLINNAILCFIEHPDQLARLRQRMELLPSAIEEVLRYRSPLQWVYRLPTRDVEMAGQRIPAKHLTLTMIGSANRDPRQFPDPDGFDITRQPNAHIAFGNGNHFCLGAPLARLEAKIALTDLLTRFTGFELDGPEPWEPRRASHVHGPTHLPIRFQPA